MGIFRQIALSSFGKIRTINNKLVDKDKAYFIVYYETSAFVMNGEKVLQGAEKYGYAELVDGSKPLEFGQVTIKDTLITWYDPRYCFEYLTKSFVSYSSKIIKAYNENLDEVLVLNHPSFVYPAYTAEGWKYYLSMKYLVSQGYDLADCGKYFKHPSYKLNGRALDELSQPSLKNITSSYSYEDNDFTTALTKKLSRSFEFKFEILNIKDLVASMPYSFGVEFEVSSSETPPALLPICGLVPLLDGSTRSGLELVTIPLSGERGIYLLHSACTTINKYCRVDRSCSLHVHIGGLDGWKPLHIAALYMLYYRIQEDILDFQPFYVRNPVAIAGKGKAYSERLPSLGVVRPSSPLKGEQIYPIVRSMFMGEKDDLTHYKGPKWNISSRYWALNLLPWFTGGGRVEFRVHHPTSHPIKVFAWVLICQAIVQYAYKYAEEITYHKTTKIKLEDVIRILPKNISEALWFYLEDRLDLRNTQFREVMRQSMENIQSQSSTNRIHMSLIDKEFEVDTIEESYDLVIINEE